MNMPIIILIDLRQQIVFKQVLYMFIQYIIYDNNEMTTTVLCTCFPDG